MKKLLLISKIRGCYRQLLDFSHFQHQSVCSRVWGVCMFGFFICFFVWWMKCGWGRLFLLNVVQWHSKWLTLETWTSVVTFVLSDRIKLLTQEKISEQLLPVCDWKERRHLSWEEQGCSECMNSSGELGGSFKQAVTTGIEVGKYLSGKFCRITGSPRNLQYFKIFIHLALHEQCMEKQSGVTCY